MPAYLTTAWHASFAYGGAAKLCPFHLPASTISSLYYLFLSVNETINDNGIMKTDRQIRTYITIVSKSVFGGAFFTIHLVFFSLSPLYLLQSMVSCARIVSPQYLQR